MELENKLENNINNELEKEQKNFFIRNTSKKIPTRAIDRIWLICSKKYILVRYT